MGITDGIDLALLNGKIVTVNERNELAEAVAVKDSKIVGVGTTNEIKELAGNDTKVIDLQKKTVTPGFVESHCHPSMAGPRLLFEVNAGGATTILEIIDRIRQKARQLPQEKWLRAWGYNDRRLKEKRHPTRWDLDKATTKHPVFLARLDGHMGVVNSKALKLAQITKDTPDPEGGKIDRDPETGEPTGLLRETAQALAKNIIPPYTIEEMKEGLVTACNQLASWGITSFGDAAVVRDSMVAYQELLAENRLPLRVAMMIVGLPMLEFPPYLNELKVLGIKAGFGNDRLRILGTKFMIDGSMSGYTAALYEPYSNEPTEYGIIVQSPEELTRGIVEAHKAGLRPLTHAIGDRAIDIVLDAIEKALTETPVADHRMRIEHCTLPTDEAIDRMKRLGVIPSSSVGFIYELAPAHLLCIGPERAKRYFPHKTYLEKGILSVGNSDWFVTSANIAQQLYGVVTRKGYSGEVIGPEQAISVMDALRLYTINGAYASFEEKIKGSIERGKLADMVVLDRDILTIPEEEIKDIKVEMTIVGGEIVYQRGA
ncbi:MAG: amidohydrolase [Thermodesulfobacteriota bacterium]